MKKIFLLGLAMTLLSSCVPNNDKNIEEARFFLDKGEFSRAATLAQEVLEGDPDNNEAKFIYGSALIGTFALSPKSGCDDADTGYLGVLACLLDDSEEGDNSGFKTFGRIAPVNDNQNEDIQTALTVLSSIDSFNKAVPQKDVALQRLIARTFALSTVYERTNANSCNNAAIAGTYSSTPINTTVAEEFVENLRGIQADADEAGLDLDFRVLVRANRILDDIDEVGGTEQDAVRALFDDAFTGEPSC
jgi:hypothetical protein